MSQYLLLQQLNVQNANAIAGLTYGFPAITNFLGFAHALSRKLSPELGASLGGVAVISHQNIVHARQPKGRGDYVFALTRNALNGKGDTLFDKKGILKSAPINEEGRLHMTVSLLIEVAGLIAGDNEIIEKLIHEVTCVLPSLRLAGGQIISWESINVTQLGEDAITLRRLMPGYALIDRSDYLAKHHTQLKQQDVNACLFDAWCDFAQLKFRAEKLDADQELASDDGEPARIKATWTYVRKPEAGYLVPITTGYCAISPVYQPGEVANVRDASVPVAFAEAAYSVGEWMGAHRVKTIVNAIWRYEHQYPWYLAKTKPFVDEVAELSEAELEELLSL